MNIPRVENNKSGSFHRAYKKQHYPRLKILYAISKLLSNFESPEKSFPEILALGAEGFPLMTAVLIEHWEQKTRTTIWHAENATPEQIAHATLNAKIAYAYMAGSSLSQAAELQTEISSLRGPHILPNYIVLPLIIDKLPSLGALQFQGSVPLDEHDLEFVGALTDLISVALDRFYRTQKEREFRNREAERDAEKITALENERDLREVFVTLLTHDLRTPLSAALMSAQLIGRRSEDVEACQSLANRIINDIKRADQMIGDLLDANSIRSGEQLPLSIEKFEMSDLITATLEELTTVHGDRFHLICQERIEGHWDRKGVRRIIENLCNNAVKYGSPFTPINLTLKLMGKEVQISVINQGEVISAEDQKILFQQFRRGENAKSSSKKGWGIGLTLVQGVAEAHGGRVAVESGPKQGTIFTVALLKDTRKNNM